MRQLTDSDHEAVSIHASAREATPRRIDSRHPQAVSIHASAREATWKTRSICCTGSFNPRLREGGDLLKTMDAQICYQFQSTPPRGRRPSPVSLPFV